jgi:hypothetical protein
MLLSAILAIWLRVNLPIAVALVWITNPLTMPPMFYAAYKVGAWVLNLPPKEINFEISIEWLMGSLNGVMEPFLLGCLIIGGSLAVAGYFTTQFAWRLIVVRNWKRRQNNKK